MIDKISTRMKEKALDSRARGSNSESPAGTPLSFPLFLKVGFWFCILIAVAVAIRRLAALAVPSRAGAPPQLAALDAYFAAHAAVTYAHILCALVFVLLLPLLFWSRTRGSVLLGRTMFPLGIVVAGTAYAMSAYAVGGWLERSAVFFFNTLFVFSLIRAWSFGRRGETLLGQRWMLRAIAILLGIATTRPVMGIFFATAPVTHLTPHQFFGIAFWIGFSVNTVVMELWLRRQTLGFAYGSLPIGTGSTPVA